jgi:hypothetical protein
MQVQRGMNNKKTKDDQEDSSDDSQYFWGFGGHDFIKRPSRKVYEPIRYRPNDERSTDQPVPVPIRVKRDFLDWAAIVAGWIISLGTLLVLALYTYYTRGQWHELIKATNASTEASQTAACALAENERQFNLMFGQIKTQTDAQVTSGNATKRAANVASESLTSVQRALAAFLGNIGVEKDIGDNKISDLTLTFPFQNIGNTSTVGAKGQVNWKIFDLSGMPSNFDFADQGLIQQSRFDIPSRAAGNATVKVPVQYLEMTKRKVARFYVWGWLTYNDVFKGTPEHLTEFCDELIGVKITKDDPTDPTADFSWNLALCNTHNCYDDQCTDYASQIKRQK